MRMIVELRFDFITGTAFAIPIFLGWIFRVWVATLNHEAFNDAVKSSAVVESGARQLLEIRDCFRCGIVPKLHHHFPLARFDHGDFI